jgi:predicted nucleotidyltransferase
MDKNLLEAIALLQEVTRSAGLEIYLVGALASDVAAREADLPTFRGSQDADFAVQVDGWVTFKKLRSALIVAKFDPVPKIEHRFRLHGALVDIIPFGPEIAAPHGQIVWPESNHEMVVVGLSEAADVASEVDLSGGLRVRCISAVGIALLKIISFMERRKSEKGPNDAADLLYWLKNYASGPKDNRRFDVLGRGLEGVNFENAGAALLGAEVGKITFGIAHEYVERFLQDAGTAYGHFVNAAMPGFFDADRDDVERDRIVRLVSAFGQGYQAPRQIAVLGWHTNSVQTETPTFEVYYDLRPPAPTNRMATSLTLQERALDAWHRVIKWAGTQTGEKQEYQIGLEVVEVPGVPNYFGRVAIGAETATPNAALEVGSSFRFGGTERSSKRRRWSADEIPADCLWWISQIDRLAWKVMQRDIAERIRR